MKYVIIIIGIFLFSCSSVKDKDETVKKLYNVTKVDSLNNYYLIYAKKQDTLYKIISKKEVTIKYNAIKINSKYNFDLHSIGENASTIGGVKVKPINHMDVNCYQFDEETSICKENGIYDLYTASNVKGLCFVK